MIYPPGKGKSGPFLMQLWRDYLEQYADREGDVEAQTVVAANHAVEILTSLSRTLDRHDRYSKLIDQRHLIFREGSRRARNHEDRILNATFSIYNSLNTLSHQFTEGNPESSALIAKVDEQVHLSTKSGKPIEMSAGALRACFPLLGLISIALDQNQVMTGAIRQLEQRFAAGSAAAATEWEHLLNALYRIVEILQIVALLTDSELADQIHQIATRFKEEDQTRDPALKVRNGFCRLFELGHLLVTHVDAIAGA